MKFTDGDLHQLKTELNQGGQDIAIWAPCLQALLHRLECAEAYAEFRIRFSSGHDGEKEKLEAWEKSKGER